MNQSADTLFYHDAFPGRLPLAKDSDTVAKQQQKTESLFSRGTLNTEHDFVSSTKTQKHFQPFWFLLASLLLLLIFKYFLNEKPRAFFQGFFVFKKSSKQYASKSEGQNSFTKILIFIVFIVNFSLTVTTLLQTLKLNISTAGSLMLFLTVMGFVSAFAVLKLMVLLISNFIFADMATAREQIQLNAKCAVLCTVILVPANFLFIYTFTTPEFGYIILIITALLFLMKLIGSYSHFSSVTSFPSYQIILYLCTLEILPLLIVLKYTFTRVLEM